MPKMKKADIVVGGIYASGNFWNDKVWTKVSQRDFMETGEKPELISHTKRKMYRVVLDIFKGQSGEWIAFRLPWNEIRIGRLSSFMRWAKERLEEIPTEAIVVDIDAEDGLAGLLAELKDFK